MTLDIHLEWVTFNPYSHADAVRTLFVVGSKRSPRMNPSGPHCLRPAEVSGEFLRASLQ